MRQLELSATIKHVRPPAFFLTVDCVQQVKGYVRGDRVPEEEFSELASFRKAVIALILEVLQSSGNPEKTDLPKVSVEIRAQGDDPKDFSVINCRIERRSRDREAWLFVWTAADDSVEIIFFDLPLVLDWMKRLLVEKTGEWASKVTFSSGEPHA